MLDDSEENTFKGTSRGWCFTIHNYTDEQLRRGMVWLETHECIGISAGLEISPKTGSPHIQGYVRLNDSVKKGRFRKIIGPNSKGLENFWMKKANADWTANAKYTSKDENVIWFKIPPVSHQGVRTELDEFKEAIKRKADDAELFEKHLPVLAKYPKLENRLKQSFLKAQTREFRDVQVIVHWGKTGTGKTRTPYEEGAFLFDDYDNGWWDGYDGESVICLDEFYGGIKFSSLLRWLDGYQLRLKIKGGFTYAQWSKVYITSNVPPSQWYPNINDERKNALFRRFSQIKEFT